MGGATNFKVGTKHHERKKILYPIFQMWGTSKQISVRGVEIQSVVQYWIKTVCCRSKDHFHWTAPCPKSGGTLSPHTTWLRCPWLSRKNSQFLANDLRYLGKVICPWLLWNVSRKAQVANWSVSVPMTLSDIDRWDVTHAVDQIVQVDLCNYARTIWPRTNEFGRATRGEGHISRGQPCPHPKGPLPESFWDPNLCPYGLTQSDQIW